MNNSIEPRWKLLFLVIIISLIDTDIQPLREGPTGKKKLKRQKS